MFDESAYADAVRRCAEVAQRPAGARLVLSQIIDAAAEGAGLTASDLTGPSRVREVFVVRAEAMKIAREQGYTLVQIGSAFGGRHYSTVRQALKHA